MKINAKESRGGPFLKMKKEWDARRDRPRGKATLKLMRTQPKQKTTFFLRDGPFLEISQFRIWWWDSNSQPLERVSPPMTTRPGFPSLEKPKPYIRQSPSTIFNANTEKNFCRLLDEGRIDVLSNEVLMNWQSQWLIQLSFLIKHQTRGD